MCQNNNSLFVKIATAVIVSIIVGILGGIALFSFITAPQTFALIELITALVTLAILLVTLLYKNGKNTPSFSLASFLRFLLAGAIGSTVFSVLIISITLTTSALSSVIFGIAVGFFVLLLFGIVYVIDKLVTNYYQQ